MHEQPSLFEEKTESRFTEFLRAHPEIYQAYCRLALDKIRAGAKRIGSKAIWEVLRWNTPLREDGSEFKLNNNLTPFFARKFQKDYPQYADRIETRRAKADAEI